MGKNGGRCVIVDAIRSRVPRVIKVINARRNERVVKKYEGLTAGIPLF